MSSSGSNSNISAMSATKAPLNSSSPNNTSMYGGMKSRRNVPSGNFASGEWLLCCVLCVVACFKCVLRGFVVLCVLCYVTLCVVLYALYVVVYVV